MSASLASAPSTAGSTTAPSTLVSPELASPELVVLLDDDGQPIGVADKATVHTRDTPRHLAFSCYAFNPAGQVLMTQRAAGKKTFPSQWSNTCCGHPAPGETLEAAAARRMSVELGLLIDVPIVVLPDFSYCATDGRVRENELCPVLWCYVDGDPRPNPDEVQSWEWWSWAHVVEVATTTQQLSPWARLQIPQLNSIWRSRPPQQPAG